jgi:hypothetical protein
MMIRDPIDEYQSMTGTNQQIAIRGDLELSGCQSRSVDSSRSLLANLSGTAPGGQRE